MSTNTTTGLAGVAAGIAAVAILGLAAVAPAHAAPLARGYTIGGSVSIIISWGPASCIQLDWPTATQNVCNSGHSFVAHQYNVRPGQVIGVDPVISGNLYASCTVVDDYTGMVVKDDAGTLGDGYDVNCLVDTY